MTTVAYYINESPIIQDLMKLPLLTADEEKALARRRDEVDPSLEHKPEPTPEEREMVARRRGAIDELVARNQRMVDSLARCYVNRGVDFPDLVSAGQFGLMIAAERFDAERGLRFSTYATRWIRQSIHREVANAGRTIRIPCYVQGKIPNGKRARRECVDAATFVATASVLSIDAEPGAFDPWYVEADEVDDAAEARKRIRLMIAKLPLRHGRLVELLYGLNGHDRMTLTLAGKLLGIDRKTVAAIRDEAMAMMRKMLTADAA